VGAGRDDGLAVGAELVVVRGDTTAAVLRAEFLSSHQAACRLVRGAPDVAPGDRVRYTPGTTADSTAPPGAATVPPRPRAPRRPGSAGLHGRVATRYGLSRLEGGGHITQPAIDARVTGVDVGGTPLGIIADVRGRSLRSSQPTAGLGTDVYQLALLWRQPGAPFRLAVGRQYLAAVTSVVLLDGALAEMNGRRVSFGLFGGAEPSARDAGRTAPVRDVGAYVQLRSPRDTVPRRSWTFTLGAAGSYAAAQPNREFGFAQLAIVTPALWLHASQQLDYYRAAKVAAGEPTLSPTSSYIAATLRGRVLAVDAGFDGRRNVRLYRDLTDPLAAFDDSYRRAAWGGATLSSGRVRLRVEGRSTLGGAGGAASAVTASGGIDRWGPGFGAAARVTRYRSAQVSGWLAALRLGADPTPVVHVETSIGLRRETNPPAALGVRFAHWYGAAADVALGRAWYAVLSLQRDAGPDGVLNQVYASVSWRF
jgi:hypothetical protein